MRHLNMSKYTGFPDAISYISLCNSVAKYQYNPKQSHTLLRPFDSDGLRSVELCLEWHSIFHFGFTLENRIFHFG